MKLKVCLLLALSLLLIATSGFCQEKTASTAKVAFGFEEKVPSWEIPDWSFEKEGYVGEGVAISTKFAKEGQSSLELMVNFPGGKWTAAYAEVQQYFDWTAYKTLSADIYLPKEAPFGLQARFILTVGKDWTWTEMARLAKLVPGEWTTVSVNLTAGSTDWRGIQVTDEFRADVRKLGIRIESNMKPVYSGPVYIDNVRLE
jgi:hypothetical protein